MTEKGKQLHEKIKNKIPEDVREHAKSARAEMRNSIISLLPPEFVEHRRAARKEMLLAVQKVIGHAIDRLEIKES